MSSSVLGEVLQEVKAIMEKVVEERLIDIEEPSPDEARATKGYLKAKEKGGIQLVPLEDVEKET